MLTCYFEELGMAWVLFFGELSKAWMLICYFGKLGKAWMLTCYFIKLGKAWMLYVGNVRHICCYFGELVRHGCSLVILEDWVRH
jgi:hypothetical protein